MQPLQKKGNSCLWPAKTWLTNSPNIRRACDSCVLSKARCQVDGETILNTFKSRRPLNQSVTGKEPFRRLRVKEGIPNAEITVISEPTPALTPLNPAIQMQSEKHLSIKTMAKHMLEAKSTVQHIKQSLTQNWAATAARLGDLEDRVWEAEARVGQMAVGQASQALSTL
jgi:hypothetical protein